MSCASQPGFSTPRMMLPWASLLLMLCAYSAPSPVMRSDYSWKEPREEDIGLASATYLLWEAEFPVDGHPLSKAEQMQRQRRFRERFEEVARHNTRFDRHEVGYTKGLNMFSADERHFGTQAVEKLRRTEGEEEGLPVQGSTFGIRSGADPLAETKGDDDRVGASVFVPPETSVTEVNWQHLDTPSSSQGTWCKACWAFASVALVETHLAIAGWPKVKLSVQELIDCEGDQKTCSLGYWEHRAIDYIEQEGITALEHYPYVERDNNCQRDQMPRTVPRGMLTRANVERGEGNLRRAVTVGPALVKYLADSSFMDYSHGVYESSTCTTQNSEPHALVVVGYTPDYWIVKNSWGQAWGMNGYAHIKRLGDTEGTCGIAKTINTVRDVQSRPVGLAFHSTLPTQSPTAQKYCAWPFKLLCFAGLVERRSGSGAHVSQSTYHVVDGFYLGPKGGLCPEPSHVIRTLEECRKAHAALELEWVRPLFLESGSGPAGCSWHASKQNGVTPDFRFNNPEESEAMGFADPGLTPVCQRGPWSGKRTKTR